MAYKVKLEQFEGPLDLLLEIVEAKKFNILHLSLSALAEQFLAYLRTIPEKNLSEISGFIAVGARLALLKSRELVPSLIEEEDGTENNLKRQLAVYQPYRVAAKKLERLSKSLKRYFSRDAFISQPPVFTFPSGLTSQILADSMDNVLGRVDHARKIPQAKIKETISLDECIDHLKRVMQGKDSLNFTSYLSDKLPQEHVIHFIGLLELVRVGHVTVKQRVAFGTIEINTYDQK